MSGYLLFQLPDIILPVAMVSGRLPGRGVYLLVRISPYWSWLPSNILWSWPSDITCSCDAKEVWHLAIKGGWRVCSGSGLIFMRSCKLAMLESPVALAPPTDGLKFCKSCNLMTIQQSDGERLWHTWDLLIKLEGALSVGLGVLLL